MAKKVEFCGSSRNDILRFPDDARRVAGYQLHRVECGEKPSEWKPMPVVGPGVEEIRIHCHGEFRVIYIMKFPEKIYVLHAFHKKEGKTSKRDLDLARARYLKLVADLT